MRDEHSLRDLVQGQDVLFNLAGQTSHLDSLQDPYTDLEIPRLARDGVRKLRVMCPAFVSDCLETIEEIGMRGKETFLKAGGHEFTMIPCLNEHPKWIEALEKMVTAITLKP